MQDFKISLTLKNTPQEVFDAINNISAWWGPIEGSSQYAGDEFIYRHRDMHYSKHKVAEMVPGRKVVWVTIDSRLNFVRHHDEWDGTKIVFEIKAADHLTILTFTQKGLTPSLECYGGCSGAWAFYIGVSLRELIVQGKGQPDK